MYLPAYRDRAGNECGYTTLLIMVVKLRKWIPDYTNITMKNTLA